MFELPPLPYAEDALAPHISRDTMQTHHGKHHAAYIKKTNALIEEKGWNETSLEAVVRRAAQEKDAATLFNNAAQAWNHAFFWQSLTPQRKALGGELADALERKYGSDDKLRSTFLDQGEKHFASGWLWLVIGADAEPKFVDLHDAQTPIVDSGVTPLLVCDLWEHAYYLDRKNERRAYLEAVYDNLLNWDFAQSQYRAAREGGDGWRFADAFNTSQQRKNAS